MSGFLAYLCWTVTDWKSKMETSIDEIAVSTRDHSVRLASIETELKIRRERP